MTAVSDALNYAATILVFRYQVACDSPRRPLLISRVVVTNVEFGKALEGVPA